MFSAWRKCGSHSYYIAVTLQQEYQVETYVRAMGISPLSESLTNPILLVLAFATELIVSRSSIALTINIKV